MGSLPLPTDADGRSQIVSGTAVLPPALSDEDFLVNAHSVASGADDDAASEEFPRHPVRCMQGAFEESIMDTHDPHDVKTRNTIDAATRRLQLLELEHFADAYSSRWKQKAGSRYHPLWKLIAQISFGVHLLHQNIAKSEQEVVNILQGHIREVDGFLEDVTADFDLALQDIQERTQLLEMPLEHGHTFDRMLRDHSFRVAIVEGNDIIERIIYRTRKAMKLPLTDLSKGREASEELAKYLERIGLDWTGGSEELLDIMAAMRGNAEGWHRAFCAVEATGADLSARLGRLDLTVTEVSRRAGEASRKENAIKQAQLQHQAREHARQIRATRSTPHLASRTMASPTMSSRTTASPALSQRAFPSPSSTSTRHVSSRVSQINKPLPTIPALRNLMSHAHERSASQPVPPTQPQPVRPAVAATEPSTPELAPHAGVSYFSAASSASGMSDTDSSEKSSAHTARPDTASRPNLDKGYSDKEIVVASAAPAPVASVPSLAAVSVDSLTSFATATESRLPLLKEAIAEESTPFLHSDVPHPQFMIKVHDMDDSTNSSTKKGSSCSSSESDDKRSEDADDSTHASDLCISQTDKKPQSPRAPRVSQFGLFPTLNGPPPGAHPLHSNRVSGTRSAEIPIRVHKRTSSQETTALPPCLPQAEPSNWEPNLRPRRGLATKSSFVSIRSLFGKKQPQRQLENGGLGGHANYAM